MGSGMLEIEPQTPSTIHYNHNMNSYVHKYRIKQT